MKIEVSSTLQSVPYAADPATLPEVEPETPVEPFTPAEPETEPAPPYTQPVPRFIPEPGPGPGTDAPIIPSTCPIREAALVNLADVYFTGRSGR